MTFLEEQEVKRCVLTVVNALFQANKSRMLEERLSYSRAISEGEDEK